MNAREKALVSAALIIGFVLGTLLGISLVEALLYVTGVLP